MRLTIVTAAWNAVNLPKVIESIDNQTYKDFQHIIVNDNNPEVREVFKGLCDGKKRHWVDIGVRTHYYGALARNIGVMVAFSYIHASKRDIDNEWIVFHDDDNLWEPNHLESMVKTAEESDNAVMIGTDAQWVGATDKSWKEVRICNFRHCGCDLGQFMYKTTLFKKYGYFDPHPRRKQKYDWELLKKIIINERKNIHLTNRPTFIMNYKKK